jgi:hypothetical protein
MRTEFETKNIELIADKIAMKLPSLKEIKPRMLSVRDTARYMGIAEKTLRNRLGPKAEHPFPVKPKHFGGKVLFDRNDVDTYLDSLPTRL